MAGHAWIKVTLVSCMNVTYLTLRHIRALLWSLKIVKTTKIRKEKIHLYLHLDNPESAFTSVWRKEGREEERDEKGGMKGGREGGMEGGRGGWMR